MGNRRRERLSALEYHVLLALTRGALYGYAVKEAIEDESGGSITPRTGSLYRVLARLMSWGLAEEVEGEDAGEPHPGLERRYYALTPEGRDVLREEAAYLRRAAALAEGRLGIAESGR